MVYTLDVITPIVDDPRAFGRIAAANSLSDVYAMGATPEVALSFAGIPDVVGKEVLRAVLHGMAEKAVEAGCAIVGGHTLKDAEPKCGLAVIGSVDPDAAWTHKRAKAGQTLVLTKGIGTGIIAQALKADAGKDAWLSAMTTSMETLNDRAAKEGAKAGATACTDVTGFGLLGHLMHVAEASGVDVQLDCESVPLLDGAKEAAATGFIPGGTKRNLAYAQHALEVGSIDQTTQWILADAQTSGGLLLAVPPSNAAGLVSALDGAAIIGSIVDGTGKIHLR